MKLYKYYNRTRIVLVALIALLFLISFFIFILIISCKDNVDKIIDDQNQILELSLNKEIICDQNRDYFGLITKDEENILQNEYIFKQKNGENDEEGYVLFRDSIEFSPDEIIGINNESIDYKDEICAYFLKTTQFIKSYNMKSLSWNMYATMKGPRITIFMNSGELLIYNLTGEKLDGNDSIYFKEVRDGWYVLK